MSGLLAAALILFLQAMPVVRLAGGPGEQSAGAQPAQTAASPSAPQGLPVTQLDPGAAAITLDSPRRLTLSFAEPRPVQEVMRLLVAGTPLSLSVDAEIDGTFQGELKQLTLREALHTLLDPLGLDFELHGTVIRVRHDHTEMRQFDLNLLAVQRAMTRTAGAGAVTVVTTAQGDDVFAAIADGVQALLSPGGRVHVDRRAGLVQVTDYPERLDRVALYLEALQVRSGRQVRLEARVFEVMLNDGAAIDWRGVREKLGLARDAPQAGLAADPSALQAALADQGDIRVLSAPEVTAMNNEPALVRAGTPGVSSLTLTVVPQIAADGVVQLSVSHAWEEQDGSNAPRTAEADTVTRVMDGHTVMIAGLLRPALVTMPGRGMGALFGGAAKRTMQAELVVLLRATVVTAGSR
jgi:type II secretory pathway component GspD/PulD (secretin)